MTSGPHATAGTMAPFPALRRLRVWQSLCAFSLAVLSVAEAASAAPASSRASGVGAVVNAASAGSTSTQSIGTAKAAREIASAILTVYGGVDKLKELDEQVCTGKGRMTEFSSISQAANTFQCDMVSKGDKVRVEINVMGQPTITAYDGERGWLKLGDQVFPADPKTVGRIQSEVRHSLQRELINLGDPKAKIALRKPATVMGQMCDTIEVIGADNETTTIYADQKTHLVLAAEWMGSDSEQGLAAKVSNEFSDYRPVLGTMEPFKVIEYTNGKKTSEAVQDTIGIDNTIPDSIFDMPAEPEIARLKQGPVVIPFEYDGHQIMIKCRVNKAKTCLFVTDTGASQSILDQAVASTLGTTKSSGYAVTTGSGSVQMNYMNISSLELGDLVLENFPIGVMDGKAFAQMQGVRPDGLIGANILKRFLVTIDYEHKKLILQDPRSVVIAPGAVVVPTQPAMGNLGMIVEGKLDGKLSAHFLVDTGAAFNNISPKILKPLMTEPLLKVGRILGMDGKQIDIGSMRLKSLQLGDLKVPDPTFCVAITPDTGAGGIITSGTLAVLGNPFWSHFNVTIDYRNNRLILEQSAQRKALDELELDLREARFKMLKSKNYDTAFNTFKDLAEACRQKQSRAGEALCITEELNARTVKGVAKEEILNLLQDFQRALALARESGDEGVQARVLVRYVSFIEANSGEASTMTKDEQGRLLKAMLEAKLSVNKAVAAAPNDPEVLCALSLLLVKTKPELAEKGFDQALAYDPSNWDALWGKYELVKKKNDMNTLHLVEGQLKRYYSGVPAVDALGRQPKGH